MSEIIKIGIFAVAGVLFAVLLRTQKPEYGVSIGLAVGIVIFAYAVKQMENVVGQFESIRQYLGQGEQYLTILLKVIGITYICEFSAGICKDAGYAMPAQQIEILGKLSVLFAGLPILLAVIEKIRAMTG